MRSWPRESVRAPTSGQAGQVFQAVGVPLPANIREKTATLEPYMTMLARLGGDLAAKANPPPSKTVICRDCVAASISRSAQNLSHVGNCKLRHMDTPKHASNLNGNLHRDSPHPALTHTMKNVMPNRIYHVLRNIWVKREIGIGIKQPRPKKAPMRKKLPP